MKSLEYFDTHCHLNLSDFDEDRNLVIEELKKQSIGAIIVGVDNQSSIEAVNLAIENENLFACVGLHPVDDPNQKFDFDFFENLTKNKKTVAIGECGLDYFRLEDNIEKEKERQKDIFKSHIELALKTNLPLMLHCRPKIGSMDAYEDTLDILEEYKKENMELSGNAHFFVGSIIIAERFLKIGFSMSFPGVITFTNDYDEVLKSIPIENILSETDAPFATPVPFRGKRNSPLYVKEVVNKIAEIKNIDLEELKIKLIENTKRVFKI